MKTKFYSFVVAVFATFISAQSINAQQLIAGTFSGTVENLLGVRYRNVRNVNTNQTQALFVGIPDLGSSRSGSRVDDALNYGTSGSYTFSITYNPALNTFTTVTTIGAGTTTTTLNNVSSRLTSDGKTATAPTINYFGLAVRTQNGSSTIRVSNLVIEGIPFTGNYERSNDNGESQWYTINTSLTNGFTITGTVTLSGSFSNSTEGQRIQFFFGYTASSAGSLPVTWGDFSAKRNNNSTVQLNWETIQEINASHFDVERSEDGARFTKIGSVQAVGTTQSRSNYIFADNNASGSVYYYRLAQYDNDGKRTFSSIAKVGNSNTKTLFATTGNSVRVQFFEAGSKQIRLMNTNGTLIRQVTVSNMQADIDVTGLSKGVHILQVVDGKGQSEVFRFMR
jgi:hypothetical protein